MKQKIPFDCVGDEQKWQDPTANMHIPWPVTKLPQAKALFNTVLFMARRGSAHRQMHALMELQKKNKRCNVRYEIPVLVHPDRNACPCTSGMRLFQETMEQSHLKSLDD